MKTHQFTLSVFKKDCTDSTVTSAKLSSVGRGEGKKIYMATVARWLNSGHQDTKKASNTKM
jgi:hypothetical protein